MPAHPALPRLIGVIHLQALPGAPGSAALEPQSALQKAGLQAVQEATALTHAGFEGLILENFGDAPFFRERVPAETVSSLAIIAAAVREATRLPIGINVLRNDANAALAIAAVTGCQFIRVNVLSGVAATDQGLIEGKGAELVREKCRLAPSIRILADAHVKHARALSSERIAIAIEELGFRSLADGVIITGETTGRPVSRDELTEASKAAQRAGVPLYIGSGATAETLAALLDRAHGVIVGSAIRRGGQAGARLDPRRAREFVRTYRKNRRR